jgi:hypothetical protein
MRNTFNTSSATMRDNGNSSDDSSLKVIPLEQIQGDDDEDTFLLVAMAKEAERYVQSFPWCATLKEGIYADGIGGVIALFVFRADIKKLGDNQWICVHGDGSLQISA